MLECAEEFRFSRQSKDLQKLLFNSSGRKEAILLARNHSKGLQSLLDIGMQNSLASKTLWLVLNLGYSVQLDKLQFARGYSYFNSN
ncbi:hypothetical protein MANES_16G038850v8 [Manihot esculenta]|uniref:Uncharacterized protein n=1 Tax=Manihot esculenta TaxID=3983 RepID=A0ACB7G5T3_MANES|nr:hypothetical protein MANES_16G038850v8 [Manihot esculenta]